MMKYTRFVCFAAAFVASSASAAADLTVNFKVRDSQGNPAAGAVASGSELAVEILLSVDASESPVRDVRLIQFDFSSTSEEIQLDEFIWQLEPGVTDAAYLRRPELPNPSATFVQTRRTEGLIIDLTDTPVRVATVNVTVNAAGTLSVRGGEIPDPTNGTLIVAGFDEQTTFSSAEGTLLEGSLDFQISTGGGLPPDTDGDGTADDMDAFPNDPNETIDTDADGTGDVADLDDDDDGVMDSADQFPADDSETTDTDGDGSGDNSDTDDDNDGVTDDVDTTPTGSDGGSSGGTGGSGDSGGGAGDGSNRSPSLCGIAMIQSFFPMLFGAQLMRFLGRKQRSRPGPHR